MHRQLWMIAKVWAYRPMMWLLFITTLMLLMTVQVAVPELNVRSAQYNETIVSRVSFGSFAILLLTWICMYNLNGHFSTPQRRVIPNYEKPHVRFVFGFAVLAAIASTVAFHTPPTVAWLPAMTVSLLAVTFAATLMAQLTLFQLRRPALAWVPIVIMMSLFILPLTRTVLRQTFPAMEPAMDHFLGGDQPILAIILSVGCLCATYWMIRQFTDNDRLNAEAGLPPIITVEDIGKQNQILALQRRGKTFQRALDAWHSKLKTLKSAPRGWLRNVRLDWMGESTIAPTRWIEVLAFVTVIAFAISRFPVREWEAEIAYLIQMAIGVALMIPLIDSISRRDVLPLELLFPNSRTQFMRRRTLSIAAKYSYLFAGLFVHLAIFQYFCFHSLYLESFMRAAIVFGSTTIAGTGLVLWISSIRNIFALGLLVMVGLVVFTFASFACLDFRWIEPGKSGQQIHEFVTSPPFLAAGISIAGVLLMTGYYRLSRCELARQ